MHALTASALRALWPRAPQAKIDAIAAVAPEVFDEYGITSDLCVAHLMAQISHENGAGTIVRENMNYSAPRMLEIFGVGKHSAKVTPDEAQALAHKPQAIAERVYGLGNPQKAKELGNSHKGDGYAFRGNGDLQLTGRASHRKISEAIGANLEADPGQLEDPAISFRCAVAEFVALKAVPAAEADNVDRVTVLVNGGRNGLAERRVWLRKWKAALAAEREQPPPEVEAEIPPPEEPRGGESDPVKPMGKSTIGNGAKVGTGLTVSAIGSMVWEKISEAPSQAWDAIEHLTSKPSFWIVGGVALAFAFIYWRRDLMNKNQGV